MSKLRNLDQIRHHFGYANASRVAWDRASEFWVSVRNAGMPTAGQKDLDADTILAGIAATIGQHGDSVVIATMNMKHFGRFPGINAQMWTMIS